MLQCMSLLMADFVAEVGAETWITLTLHTPNEAAAFSARALKALDTTDLNECHNAMLTKRTRTHVPAAHVR